MWKVTFTHKDAEGLGRFQLNALLGGFMVTKGNTVLLAQPQKQGSFFFFSFGGGGNFSRQGVSM